MHPCLGAERKSDGRSGVREGQIVCFKSISDGGDEPLARPEQTARQCRVLFRLDSPAVTRDSCDRNIEVD